MHQIRNILMTMSLVCLLGPMSLQASGEHPEVLLSLDTHNSYYSKADQAMHKELAKAGLLIQASEGLLYGDKSDNEHGYEDPLPYGLSRMVQTHAYMHGCVVDHVSCMDDFKHFFVDARVNGFLREEWAELRKRGWITAGHETERQIHDLLDRFLDPTNGDNAGDMAKLVALEATEKEQALLQTFRRFCLNTVRHYNTEVRFQYGTQVKLPEIDAPLLFGDPFATVAAGARDRLVLELRNEFMALNLARIYEIAKQKKVPLVVVIGEAHAEGILPLLARLLGPDVPIRTRDSREAFKALYESPSPDRTVEILLAQYQACRPVQHGFRIALVAAESSGKLFLLEEVQKGRRLKECPKTLTLEQAVACQVISGSNLPEPELRGYIPTLQDYALPLVFPCAIL